MTRRPSGRLSRGVVTVAATAACLLAAVAPAMASPALYGGGGIGPTAEVAIQTAIADAENSASTDGRFSCVLVGEPLVAHILDDPDRGDFWRASVEMLCE